jgi:pimeloyl-ACP methyl ester carboxylesterase
MTVFTAYEDVTLRGGPIRLYRAGPAIGPPTVLLHGAMYDTAPLLWRDVMPALAADRDVVAIDLPRHGGSRPWTGVLDQPRLEEVLAALLDHVGADRADLVGLSMGAGLAIGFALNHPDRVRGLVAAAPGGIEETRPWQFLTWLFLRPALLRWSAALLAASPGLLRRSMIRSLAAGDRTPGFEQIMELVRAEAEAKRRDGDLALDDWQITAYGPRRMRLNHLPRLPGLAVPSLWIYGRQDTLVGEETMRRAVAATPGAHLEIIEDAGHLSPLDRPDVFTGLVRSFLARLDADQTSTAG